MPVFEKCTKPSIICECKECVNKRLESYEEYKRWFAKVDPSNKEITEWFENRYPKLDVKTLPSQKEMEKLNWEELIELRQGIR